MNITRTVAHLVKRPLQRLQIFPVNRGMICEVRTILGGNAFFGGEMALEISEKLVEVFERKRSAGEAYRLERLDTPEDFFVLSINFWQIDQQGLRQHTGTIDLHHQAPQEKVRLSDGHSIKKGPAEFQ